MILQKKLNEFFLFFKINPEWKNNENITINSQIGEDVEY